MRAYFLFAVIFTVLVSSYGCAKPVAEVNGEVISQDMLKAVLSESVRQHASSGKKVVDKNLRDAVIQQLIGEKLLLQSAKDAKVTVTEDEVKAELENIKKTTGEDSFNKQLKEKELSQQTFIERLRSKMIIKKYIDGLVPVDSITEDEKKAFYKQTPKMFIHPKRVNVRLIQTATEDEARAYLKEMKEMKISFDAFADMLMKKKDSSVTSYGWTDPTFYSESIANAMKTLKKGTYGGPYKGKDSYFILRVKDRKDETPKTYKEAKKEIQQLLLAQKQNATMLHLMEEKKKTAKIKIY